MSKQRESTDKPSAPAHRPLIYLAGPMSGCNAEQKSAWRRALRERYEDRFQFTDPMDTPVDLSANDSRFELAKRDAHAIAGADAVLANMWKESIGTAIGVVTARHAGKIVVVVDKNHLQSTFLAFYADAVAETEGKAMERIDALLKAQRAIEAVTKGDGRREPFNRAKLSGAIRRACATARKNDVLCAAEILPRVMQGLLDSSELSGGQIPSAAIRGVVLTTIDELERDTARADQFEGVRAAWEGFMEVKGQAAELDRLELLRAAYEGDDWRARIRAEARLTAQAPMNALRLCPIWEERWTSLGRELGLITGQGAGLTSDVVASVLHAISLKAAALRIGGVSDASAAMETLTDARIARNRIVHDGAFGAEQALAMLDGIDLLNGVSDALAVPPR